nr:hypothetical protein StreXyl84_67200 [Streptomyces sp. Xyl84]
MPAIVWTKDHFRQPGHRLLEGGDDVPAQGTDLGEDHRLHGAVERAEGNLGALTLDDAAPVPNLAAPAPWPLTPHASAG